MKNIETILKEAGIELTSEQVASVNAAVSENYKTVAEFNKTLKKLETAEQAKKDAEESLATANSTIEGFAGSMSADDVTKLKEDYEKKIKEAQEASEKSIAERDQRDWLKGMFGVEDGQYDVGNKRARESLMNDIISGNAGLTWRNGAYLGFDDYMKQELDADPTLYKTKEQKEAEAQKEKASGKVPKITNPSSPKTPEPSGKPDVPVIF